MKRLQRETTLLCLLASTAMILGCRAEATALPTEESHPPTKARTKSPPQQVIVIDPFATPFAVVDATTPKQKECAPLPPTEVGKWISVPVPRSDDETPGQTEPPNFRQFGPGIVGYCVYKWRNDRKLPTSDDFKNIGAVPDSAVIGGGLDAPDGIPKLPATVSRPLINLFNRQARGMASETWKRIRDKKFAHPSKLALKEAAVTVAVIDATPKGSPFRDHSGHGLAVTSVIGSLLCAKVDSDECRDQVRPYLALPMLSPTKEDRINGGDFGSFFQLADALDQALRHWKPKTNAAHLVINISIGWDPIKIVPSDPKVLRIRSLLEKASCRGALIVAAAGNYSGTDGPILPAGFETIPAPGATECERFGPSPVKPSTKVHPYAPLVHAVGAVDAMDMRLIADRRWGQPRLAAYGVNVTVEVPPSIERTPLETGTSMSAAIVTGVASAIWSARPELNAAEVMDLVYRGGVELDGGNLSRRAQTEFCVEEEFGPCRKWPVRRVYLCGALAKAIPNAGLACNGTPAPLTDMPKWPDPPLGTSKIASEPCHIAACGVAEGPMANQLIAGVIPHGGFGGCLGCTMKVTAPTTFPALPSYVLGQLAGIPTFTIPTDGSITAILKTTSNYIQYDSVQIFPTSGSDMNTMSAQPSVLSDTKSSGIWWYYAAPGSAIKDITILGRGQ